MQGEPFDWHSHLHRALDAQLLAVLDGVHEHGICHCDLHAGNMLVTCDRQIVLLDFDGARLDCTAEECIAERDYMIKLLSLKPAASCNSSSTSTSVSSL